jgi:hypothetical protein
MPVQMAERAVMVRMALHQRARSMEADHQQDRIGLDLLERSVSPVRMAAVAVVVAQAVVRTPCRSTAKTDSVELAVVVEQAVPAAMAGTVAQQEARHLESSSSALHLSLRTTRSLAVMVVVVVRAARVQPARSVARVAQVEKQPCSVPQLVAEVAVEEKVVLDPAVVVEREARASASSPPELERRATARPATTQSVAVRAAAVDRAVYRRGILADPVLQVCLVLVHSIDELIGVQRIVKAAGIVSLPLLLFYARPEC